MGKSAGKKWSLGPEAAPDRLEDTAASLPCLYTDQ